MNAGEQSSVNNPTTEAIQAQSEKLFLVTGATGFIAGHIIQQLLKAGHRVRATVRSLTKDPKMIAFLRALATGCPFPLELVEADLTERKGWDEACAGCWGLYHVAAAVKFHSSDPMKDIVKPSELGITHVFEAAAKAKIKRIVLTSSVAALFHSPPDTVVNETVWNIHSNVHNSPYNFAKTLAEKMAFEFVKKQPADQPLELTSILPSLVLGPALAATAGSSLDFPIRLLKRDMPLVPHIGFGVCDVRDVARAHLLAMALPTHGHRILISSKCMWMHEIAKGLLTAAPNYPIPTGIAPNFAVYIAAMFDSNLTWAILRANLGHIPNLDNKLSRELLGLVYTPVEDTFKATVDGLVNVGLVEKK